jgi:hypothetical protein
VTRALLLALSFWLAAAAPAAAEPVEISAQARAARAEFLLTATPPAPVATICLVDTGVNVNPDTAGVIDRIALQGDPADHGATPHGTTMAMFIGAPANGWGMVGIWPSARIVSVRSNIDGQDAFTPAGYNFGLKQCDKDASFYGSKVALLALSSETQLTPEESEAITGTIAAARSHGLNVIVSAGNNDGRAPGVPASIAGALSVGAANALAGTLCPFSATGATLLAPGCRVDGADPTTGYAPTTDQGTSQAAAIVAAAIAALRTWRPDLTPQAVDDLVTRSAAVAPDGRHLDVAAMFTAAGLAGLIPPTVTPTPTPTATPSPTPTPGVKRRLPKPKLTVRASGRGVERTLIARVTNRPHSARMTVRVYTRDRRGRLKRVATRTRSASTIRVRSRSGRRVAATFTDPSGNRRSSRSAIVNLRR